MAVDFERVEVSGLVKLFGLTRALSGVDAVFPSGAITVIEGPNGSGKSTLLSILAQLAKPTEGRVRYGDYDGGRPEVRSAMGLLGHASMLYPDFTGRENLKFFAGLYGLGAIDTRIDQLFERFQIGSYVERPVRTWSRGQTQRVSLCRALLHNPRLLLLDEPATGLDVQGIDRLGGVIREERDRGAIVIVVTHHRRFADQIADHTLALSSGRVASAARST